MKRRTKVWGCLWLKDGRQIQLDGQEIDTIKVKPSEIAHYGEQELGNEANVFVEPDRIVTGLRNVQQLFEK